MNDAGAIRSMFEPNWRIWLKIATVIVVMAAAVAAAVFDWRLLGVGAVLAVADMALFGMPVWIASVEQAAEEEKERGLAGGRSGY